MMLLEHWKESLEVFLPKNIVLFGQLTIHTMLQTIKTWLSKWWWLFFVWILFSAVTMMGWRFFNMWRLSLGLQPVMPLLILLTLALAARPSVIIKNYRYYFSYWRHVLLIVGLIVGMSHIMFFAFVRVHSNIVGFLSVNPMVLQYVVFPTLLAFLLLWIIAFLDTKFHIRALWRSLIRALKLVIYNYPFVWVMSVVAVSIAKICLYLTMFLLYLTMFLINYDPHPNMFSGLTGLVLAFTGLLFPILGVAVIIPVLWLLSTMMNMYTRQVHEHFDRYY